jgi:hypothetical protein
MSGMKQAPAYILHTLPGFDAIIKDEIKSLPGVAKIGDHVTHAGRNRFNECVHYDGEIADLLALRTVDDVFLLIHHFTQLHPNTSTQADSRSHYRNPTHHAGHAYRAALYPKRGGEGKLRFRVVARQQGEMPYRRVDLQTPSKKPSYNVLIFVGAKVTMV